MKNWLICLCVCPLVFFTLPAPAQNQAAAPLDFHLVGIKEGNLQSNLGADPNKFAASPMVKAAQRLGLDPADPAHPFIIHQNRDGRCFYLFYNTVLNVPAGYLVQRVKKTDTVVDA